MLKSFRATVQKYWGIPFSDLTNIIEWLNTGGSGVPASALSNPNLQIATVANECDQVIAYVPFEKVYVVPAYAISPKASPEEALQAGNSVDEAIADRAQSEGITRVLLILSPEHPHMPEEKVIRVVERAVERNDSLFDVGWPVRKLATPYLN